ncbi:MAG TPA: hypothetical protein VH063_05415 [Gaiellaceae bacterium]|nr:hypothetical protein [Gaiellaceae bacterium]
MSENLFTRLMRSLDGEPGPFLASAPRPAISDLRGMVLSRLQSRGGRPSDPSWTLSRLIPMSSTTWDRLHDLAQSISAGGERSASRGQVAALLLEQAVEAFAGQDSDLPPSPESGSSMNSNATPEAGSGDVPDLATRRRTRQWATAEVTAEIAASSARIKQLQHELAAARQQISDLTAQVDSANRRAVLETKISNWFPSADEAVTDPIPQVGHEQVRSLFSRRWARVSSTKHSRPDIKATALDEHLRRIFAEHSFRTGDQRRVFLVIFVDVGSSLRADGLFTKLLTDYRTVHVPDSARFDELNRAVLLQLRTWGHPETGDDRRDDLLIPPFGRRVIDELTPGSGWTHKKLDIHATDCLRCVELGFTAHRTVSLDPDETTVAWHCPSSEASAGRSLADAWPFSGERCSAPRHENDSP